MPVTGLGAQRVQGTFDNFPVRVGPSGVRVYINIVASTVGPHCLCVSICKSVTYRPIAAVVAIVSVEPSLERRLPLLY